MWNCFTRPGQRLFWNLALLWLQRRIAIGSKNTAINWARKTFRFCGKWHFKLAVELENQVRINDGPQFWFLSGILFAPSSSTSTVSLLQRVIQADTAHMSIGKYTLFSVYSTSANSNMSPLLFGIMFGNKDKENWMTFWKFTVDLYPSINSADVTIVSDQDT